MISISQHSSEIKSNRKRARTSTRARTRASTRASTREDLLYIMVFYFENFIAWQKAFLLTENIYLLSKVFPPEEKFALIDQIRRASISVMSNIAEGTWRSSDPDRNHFYAMARWSAMEVASQLLIAQKFWYIQHQEKYSESLALIE
jgi:four helix bundle protein